MNVKKRNAAVVGLVLATLGSGMGFLPAAAKHGADDARYIQQAGNGAGVSAPAIPNVLAYSVLYDDRNFNGVTGRPGFPRYIAFGTVQNSDGTIQLAFVKGNNEGTAWGVPSPTVIRDPQDPATDVPFLLSENRLLDVVFVPTARETPFWAYYSFMNAADDNTGSIASLRRAVSADGVHWRDDPCSPATCNISQDAARPLIGAPSPVTASFGPTDVIFNLPGSDFPGCGASSAWNCRFVMYYNAVIGGEESIAVAGSHNGLNWTGPTAASLVPSASGWDDARITMAHVQRVSSNNFRMYYSGGSSAPCAGYAGSCLSVGVATSTNGATFSSVTTAAPAVPREFLEQWGTAAPASLWAPQPVIDGRDDGHTRIFYTALEPTGARNVFAASSAPAPTAGPIINVVSPRGPFRSSAKTAVEIFITDELGTNVGLNFTTLSLTIDGAPVNGLTIERSLVSAYTHDAFRLTASQEHNILSDGPHTLVASVVDLDGTAASVSVPFTVDTTAPASVLSARPASPQVGFPDSIGTFRGTTADAGVGLDRMRAIVTNPLGERKMYESTSKHGWLLTKTSVNAWDWTWIAPNLDTHFAVPGNYTVSLLGVDLGGAQERASTANTAVVLAV